MNPIEQAAEAAERVLRDYFDLGGSAYVLDYLDRHMEGEEREQAIASLQAADRDAAAKVLAAVTEALMAALERLKAAIRDIDSHAQAVAEDEDGFVAGGYLVTIGALHRALALTGTGVKCRFCEPDSHECVTEEARREADAGLVRDILEAMCRKEGLSLESSVSPAEPARNYELTLRLGIGEVFGLVERESQS